MKTQIEITSDYPHAMFNIGDKGYIDGYVQAADSRPYACVIVGQDIDLVPFHALKVIIHETPLT